MKRSFSNRSILSAIAAVVMLFVSSPAQSLAQEASSFTLVPDLVVGEASGVSFGSYFLHLAVDSKGRIYVGDLRNRHVKVLSREGKLLQTIGADGQGPGEFQAVHDVIVGRGDSLYVIDQSLRRLSVFAPDDPHPLVYTVPLSYPDGIPHHVFVPEDAQVGFIVSIQHRKNNTLTVYRMDYRGHVAPSVIVQGAYNEGIEKINQAGGRVAVFRGALPYGRKPILGLDANDKVYHGWSEEIDLTFYSLDGRWTGMFREAFTPIPITQDDIDHVVDRYESKEHRKAARQALLSRTKPACETIFVDDQGWIWIDTYTADPTMSQWRVSKRINGVPSTVFTLPEHVKIQLVQDGYAYASSEDEEGFPNVIRYRIEPK